MVTGTEAIPLAATVASVTGVEVGAALALRANWDQRHKRAFAVLIMSISDEVLVGGFHPHVHALVHFNHNVIDESIRYTFARDVSLITSILGTKHVVTHLK